MNTKKDSLMWNFFRFIWIKSITEDIDECRLPRSIERIEYRWIIKKLLNEYQILKRNIWVFNLRFKSYEYIENYYKYRKFPGLYEGELIRPQPMKGPTGLIFALKYVYNEEMFKL